jgi:hypothetical protein
MSTIVTTLVNNTIASLCNFLKFGIFFVHLYRELIRLVKYYLNKLNYLL